MKVRRFISSDYNDLVNWWKAQKWTPVPEDHLPEYGLVIDGIAAGFIYRTDSKFALLEFVIANPNTTKEERSEALDLIIDDLLFIAKELGHSTVFTSLEHPKLLERYEKHGFIPTDKNVTNMIRRLV
jgi:hypothetical protein